MTMIDTIWNWLVAQNLDAGLPNWTLLAIGLYMVAQVVVALTPSPKDNQWLAKLLQLGGLASPRDVTGLLKRPWQVITTKAPDDVEE